jgi:hypothetical protein
VSDIAVSSEDIERLQSVEILIGDPRLCINIVPQSTSLKWIQSFFAGEGINSYANNNNNRCIIIWLFQVFTCYCNADNSLLKFFGIVRDGRQSS